jgi:hypothetical protein
MLLVFNRQPGLVSVDLNAHSQGTALDFNTHSQGTAFLPRLHTLHSQHLLELRIRQTVPLWMWLLIPPGIGTFTPSCWEHHNRGLSLLRASALGGRLPLGLSCHDHARLLRMVHQLLETKALL